MNKPNITLKLEIKGVTIELSPAEAKELRDAISQIYPEPQQVIREIHDYRPWHYWEYRPYQPVWIGGATTTIGPIAGSSVTAGNTGYAGNVASHTLTLCAADN